jgi:hypothetical protein
MTPLPTAILREIRRLQTLGVDDLVHLYATLFGRRTACRKSEVLRRAIAYRMQENHYGSPLAAETRRVFLDEARVREAEGPAERPPVAGTRYVRVWKGAVHEAVRREDGNFEYGGLVYTSLSAVARAITGSRWNGKLFFGVKK